MANVDLTRAPSQLDRRARTLLRRVGPSLPTRPSATRKLARGLGWFSIALGLVELLAARQLARAIGLQGSEALVRAYGLREIATGCGLLAARTSQTSAGWMWGRVAGDALDAATLTAAASGSGQGGSQGHPLVALMAVAGAATLDVVCARSLTMEAQAASTAFDYSNRSGLGGSPEALRGAARARLDAGAEVPALARAESSTAAI